MFFWKKGRGEKGFSNLGGLKLFMYFFLNVYIFLLCMDVFLYDEYKCICV